MSYFSRLTDIVTCNLTEILDQAGNEREAIEQVIAEMEEGLGGAKRCVDRAQRSEDSLKQEITGYQTQVNEWVEKAKAALSANDEQEARNALLRKGEVEDLIAGLEREYRAAVATRDSLATTMRALEARLSEARRRQRLIDDPNADVSVPDSPQDMGDVEATIEASRSHQINDELEALKRQLGQ